MGGGKAQTDRGKEGGVYVLWIYLYLYYYHASIAHGGEVVGLLPGPAVDTPR